MGNVFFARKKDEGSSVDKVEHKPDSGGNSNNTDSNDVPSNGATANVGDTGSGTTDDKHDLVVDVANNDTTPKVGDTGSGTSDDKHDLVVDVSTDKADKNGGDGGSGAIDDKHDLVIDVPSNGATPKVGDTESGGTEDKQDLVVDVQSDNATKNGGDTGAGATKDKASQEATAYEGDAESDAKENKHNPVVGVSSVDPTSSGDVESDATTHRRNYLFFGLNISVREPTFDAESVTDYMKTVTSDFESNGVTSDYDGSPAELNGYSAAPGFERKQLFGQKVNPSTANRSNQVPVRQKLYRPPRDSLGRSRPFLKEPIWCLEPIWEAQSPVY